VAERVSYRKLPGHRRGFIKGASTWLGPDHLLLVRSMRFREEYKRYQLRDIQAVAIAHRPRFHISTRAFVIGILWAIAYLVLSSSRVPRGSLVAWALALVLIVSWFYVSAVCSCTCRIYTAVSRDELPSVYRTWVAKKFLRVIEPQITAVQGALEGGWMDALGTQDVGPQVALPPAGSAPDTAAERAGEGAPAPSSYLLVATLLADGLWHALALFRPFGWASVVSNLLALAVIGVAILVLVMQHRQGVSPAHRGLAIAALTAMGLVYYVRVTLVGAVAGARAALEKKAIAVDYTGGTLSSKIEMGITLGLGIVGLVMLVAHSIRQPGERSVPS